MLPAGNIVVALYHKL